MNEPMVTPHEHAVKHGRFVAATPEAQAAATADMERQIGRNLYQRGKPVECCVTDEMTQGYLDAESDGYVAYSRHMEREGYTYAQAFAFEGAN